MLILVGLGNTGDKYSQNRHNIGFMAVDEIVRRHSFSDWKKKFKGEVSEGIIGNQKIYVLKPSTFMNLSGESVLSIASFYKVPPENIIVFYDELDINAGKLRVKQAGGANGHNGLKSIDSHIGKNYLRVRLGIGRPDNKEQVTGYVLSDFSKTDKIWLSKLLDSVAREVPLLIQNKKDKFMSNVALTMQSPKNKENEENRETKLNKG